ncbi:hypothetical protein BYT27DRAFT_7259617 [Phlegmacium glaucopus]|nr:hypothetical protein BYT27DRAFT_7259617 [Phlegmacium glaucopus]
MDEVYEEVSFISPDTRLFSNKLKDLQNPTLARRIRVLTVWPSAVREALQTEDHVAAHEALRRQGQTPPPTPPIQHHQPSGATSILQMGRFYVDKLLDRPKRNSTGNGQSSSSTPSSPQDERLEMFQAALQSLTNLEEFNVNWFFDKGTLAWKFSLFPDIWRCISGHNLRRLSIDTYLHKMSDIVSSSGSLIHLRHLHLTLRREAHDAHTNDNVVPYFINKLAPILESLSLKTIGHQDVSFFKFLVVFPQLTKLSLAIPFDSHHLKDPSGLRQLLNKHSKLRDLSLRHQFCCGNTPQAKDAHRSHIGNYDLYDDISLPTLQSLEFGLNMPLSRENTSVLMRSMGTFGQTITSLSLKDHSLTLDELKIVLESFPSFRLKKLSLFARLLTPQLIDAIAQYCRILNSLTLDVQSVAKSEWQTDNDVVRLIIDRCCCSYVKILLFVSRSPPPPSQKGFSQALLDYAVDLDNDRWRYRKWTLSDIAVLRWEFKVGHQYDIACMKVIASVVPTIRSFAGRGDMSEDQGFLNPGTRQSLESRTRPSIDT